MANAGPDTNSCEFFLTLAPTDRLNYLHSVFGRVVRGLAILPLIKPNEAFTIKIQRVGAAARAFKNDPATFQALAGAAKNTRGRPRRARPPLLTIPLIFCRRRFRGPKILISSWRTSSALRG